MGVRDVTGYLGIATILSNIHPRKTTVSKPAEGLKVEVSMNKARVTKAGETERVAGKLRHTMTARKSSGIPASHNS